MRTGIEKVVPEGIVTTDGRLHELDVICYATGFRHNDFLWPMHITGRDGTVLREQWGHEPAAYLGITVPNFPNLFCIYGPGTNLAHGASLIFQSECQVRYILSCLHEVLAEGHEAMEPKPEVHDEYMDLYQSEISQMVWVPLGGEALALQEPRRQGLHPLAVAHPDLLGLDPRRRARRLRLHLNGAPRPGPRRRCRAVPR